MSTSRQRNRKTKTSRPDTHHRRPAAAAGRGGGRRRWRARAGPGPGVIIGIAAVIGLAVLMVLTDRGAGNKDAPEQGAAPTFDLPSTDGSQVSLSSYKGRDVLLYFSEGVGCDPCFQQMNEIEADGRLADKGLDVVPIVINDPDSVRGELSRFGIRTPFLLDQDKSVSGAYGVLGTGHHADLPGHSFILVGADGNIRWRRDYAVMFLTADDLMADLDEAGI